MSPSLSGTGSRRSTATGAGGEAAALGSVSALRAGREGQEVPDAPG